MAKKDVGKQPTNEEQMAIRQSAPQPDAFSELNRMREQQQMVNPMDSNPTGAVDGFRAVKAPIGKEAIQKATLTLQKYKEGKANLENRIVQNEQWYKLRHWECLKDRRKISHQYQAGCLTVSQTSLQTRWITSLHRISYPERKATRERQRC